MDNGATKLVMSSEFAKRKEFKLKKIENPIYVRNVNGTFNKKRPIENTVKINIYYQGHRERTEINMIREQKCYESKLKGLSNDTTLVLSDTRELDRVPDTK